MTILCIEIQTEIVFPHISLLIGGKVRCAKLCNHVTYYTILILLLLNAITQRNM